MSPLPTPASLFDQFLERTKAKAQDGLTLAELSDIWGESIDLLVDEAALVANWVGREKKDWVLQQIGDLFDVLAPSIPLPWFLQIIRPFFIPSLRAVVLILTSGLIEVAYRRLNPQS